MGCAASTAAGAFRHCAPFCGRLLPVWWPVHASRNDSVSTARTPDVVPTGTDSKGQELLPSSAPADAQPATPPAVVLEEPPDTAAQPVAPVEAATSPLGDRDDAAAATAASSSRTMMQKSTATAVASARSGATAATAIATSTAASAMSAAKSAASGALASAVGARGVAVDDDVSEEQRAEWAENTLLEVECAYLASQIYFGAIEKEGYEELLSDPVPNNWKPGMILLRHPASSTLFVVFRGTADIKDVVTDINIVPVVPYPDRSVGGLRVFGGAWNHLCTRMLDDVVPAVRVAAAAGIKRLIFTGHSLGGGCAILARFYMQTAGHGLALEHVRMRAIAFGAPLVLSANPSRGAPGTRQELDEDGAGVVQALASDVVTFVHGKDIVPRLLGPKANGSWAGFFKANNKAARASAAGAVGAAAVGAVATGGLAATAAVAAGAAMLVKEGAKYEGGLDLNSIKAGVGKAVTVNAGTALLTVPPEYEAAACNYFAVGTYVFLSPSKDLDGRFACAHGPAAHLYVCSIYLSISLSICTYVCIHTCV